jgi:bacterioferritin
MPIIADKKKRAEIVAQLTQAYWMEIETVMNYIAASVNLDGVRAEEIKKSLAADVTAELGHAQQFARRIKTLSGVTPGSYGFKAAQKSMQPPKATTDVVHVIKGVIDAEQSAIDHYNDIIKTCDGVDYVTQDLVITVLADEQEHLREFEGFLKEYEEL